MEAIRVYRATHPGVTNTQIALRALNAHHEDLADLLAAEQAAQLSPGPLFDVETTDTALPKRQVEITPTWLSCRSSTSYSKTAAPGTARTCAPWRSNAGSTGGRRLPRTCLDTAGVQPDDLPANA